MRIAEIKNKISFPGIEESDTREIDRMEDLLTSNVFGVLKNLSALCWSSLLPVPVLQGLQDTESSVDFWCRYADDSAAVSLPADARRSEPDVVVETAGHLAFIEVKYLSPFGREGQSVQHQLKREYELGSAIARSRGKEFHLVTLTPYSSSVANEIRSLFAEAVGSTVHIRFWEDLYSGLKECCAQSEEQIERRFLADLVEYLAVKGFDAEKVTDEKQRSLGYYLGDDDAEEFLSVLATLVGPIDDEQEVVSIPIASLPHESLPILARALTSVYDSDAISRSPLSNTIDDEKSILGNFLLETSEREVSDFFYRLLSEAYYLPWLQLNGRRDFSVKARIRKRGNAMISLFTVRAGDLSISIRLRR
jgi:hypothetical protein